ncbi:MAG: methyltransferase domain-containing protein [Mycobacteriales bacterium]
MELGELARHWSDFGRVDPLWAVLSDPSKKYGRWDPAEFMASGRSEIDTVMGLVRSTARGHGRQLRRRRALDFGCGVGRLTQALGHWFSRVDGVDIAPTMVETAGQMVHGRRARRRHRFHANETSDLALFADDSFDFVYTAHVLQHMEPRYSTGYLAEFFRVLRPGGITVFELVTDRVQGPGVPLPDGDFDVTIAIGGPRTYVAGERAVLPVVVRNNGSTPLPASGVDGWYHVTVGNHWANAEGTRVVPDDGRAGLPDDLSNGEKCMVELEINVPDQPGDYVLSVDCVQEGVAWFEDKGSPLATMRVAVADRLPAPEGLPQSRRRRRRKAVADQESELGQTVRAYSNDGARMEMHGVPEDDVRAIVAANGGEILDVIDWDTISGGKSLDWHRRGFICLKK